MAKPKVQVLVKIRTSTIMDVYTNEIKKSVSDVLSIEGVLCADCIAGRISTIIDPRYDIQEIADEIKILLMSDVPDIFQDKASKAD